MGRMSNVGMRFLTGSALILASAWILFAAPRWIFTLVVTLLIGLALNEFFGMVERKGIVLERWVGLIIGLTIPLSILSGFESTKGWELFFMAVVFITLFVLQLRRRDSSQAIVGIATTLFGIFYVSWCFSFLAKIRFLEGPGIPSGAWLAAFLIAVTKGGDIGAYLIGSLFGKHSLIPRISPSKTWEGSVGGLAASVGIALLFQPVLPGVPEVHLWVLGILLGVLGQLGDLSESLIKRDCQVKDSGRSLPGLGGILDALDSLLFASPICYFYMMKFLAGR